MSWPKCTQTETAQTETAQTEKAQTEKAQTERAQTESARPKSPVPGMPIRETVTYPHQLTFGSVSEVLPQNRNFTTTQNHLQKI